MERSRVTRYVRIAISALSLTVCVLLIALWVRSNWRFDERHFRAPVGEYRYWITVRSFDNRVQTTAYRVRIITQNQRKSASRRRSLTFEQWVAVERRQIARGMSPRESILGFSYHPLTAGFDAIQPHWFFVLTSASIAASPWIRWRFSLRTLLIATSLVAVVMGLVIYVAR
jgi:hypothetical protein